MNQAPYIARSIRTLWLGHASLPGLVPGGLIYGTQKAAAARPFGSMLIVPEGEPEYTTGLYYCQDYRAEIRVWGDQTLGTAGQIQTALESLIKANTKLGQLAGNTWTLHCSLEPAAVVEADERYAGRFTFIAGAAWQIQLQEQRQ